MGSGVEVDPVPVLPEVKVRPQSLDKVNELNTSTPRCVCGNRIVFEDVLETVFSLRSMRQRRGS
jgi:hypothetical protein